MSNDYKGHPIYQYQWTKDMVEERGAPADYVDKYFMTVDEKFFPDADIPFVTGSHKNPQDAYAEAEAWIDGLEE